jgi:hypothetical protein
MFVPFVALHMPAMPRINAQFVERLEKNLSKSNKSEKEREFTPSTIGGSFFYQNKSIILTVNNHPFYKGIYGRYEQ